MCTGGPELFARYAYAPNQLGYCGPSDGTPLADASAEQVRTLAPLFSGAWPYLEIMAAMTGITDPLDPRLVESYWLGLDIGLDLDLTGFATELLGVLGTAAGGYWSHLTADLTREVRPNHCFHVFGIYPWSRLLTTAAGDHALRILDNCRISSGTVESIGHELVEVARHPMFWNGTALGFGPTVTQQIELGTDRFDMTLHLRAGDEVALHWDRICGALDAQRAEDLRVSTSEQLRLTNERIAATAGTA